jgi:hypothetical protein
MTKTPPRPHLLFLWLCLSSTAFATTRTLTVAEPTQERLPDCPHRKFLPKYHHSKHCQQQRREEDQEDHLWRRQEAYDRLLDSGAGASHVPNERTIQCPVDDDDPTITITTSTSTGTTNVPLPHRRGMDRKWIVENLASTPVTVSLVHANGTETSALQPHEPSHQTILHPGDYQAVDTYEGDVYHVREYDYDYDDTSSTTNDNDTSTSGTFRGRRLLLQHRVGLVPLGRNPHQYDCRKNVTRTVQRTVTDPKTGKSQVVVEEQTMQVVAHDTEPLEGGEDDAQELPPPERRRANFRRTPTHKQRKCNTVDVGFRNAMVDCPLNVYWAANLEEMDTIPSHGKTCQEVFRFHLGVHPQPQDFFLDWQSATKWEGTYMSHTFVARLAADPDVVVDSYTLRPTQIVDCPPATKRTAETQRMRSCTSTSTSTGDDNVNDAQETVGLCHLDSTSTTTSSSTTEQGGGEVKNGTKTRPLKRWKNFWRKLRSPKSSS